MTVLFAILCTLLVATTVAAQGGDTVAHALCIALFRDYGWDWTYHAFREWEGWSVEHEPIAFGTSPACFRPSADNPASAPCWMASCIKKRYTKD